MKIHPVGEDVFHAGGQAEKEVNSLCLLFFKYALKDGIKILTLWANFVMVSTFKN